MPEDFVQSYSLAGKWLNDNQGVVSVALFVVALLLGWLSGIFSALRRRPKFRMRLLAGPTFACTFGTGKKYLEYDVHRTGVALYLKVTNAGSAASSIERISVAYHWNVSRFTRAWLKYGVGWYWLHNQTVAIHDFQTRIGESIKFYPFLIQKSIHAPTHASTFLEPGQTENGVVYFEQSDSWGGCFPKPHRKGIRIKVCIEDVFGGRHFTRFRVPNVPLEAARKFNPSFGKTIAELRNDPLPHDAAKGRQGDSEP